MTITSTNRAWAGATGSRNLDGSREARAVYLVETDDKDDQAETVASYFQTNASVPYLGDAYVYGNDSDPGMFLEEIQPVRDSESLTTWLVTLIYRTPSDNQDHDENGFPTENPFNIHNELELSMQQFTEPVEKAVYRGGITRPGGPADGDEIPPQNSCGVPFIPGLERDVSRLVMRWTRSEILFPAAKAVFYQDTVNSLQFTVTAMGQTYSVDEKTAKLQNISGRQQIRQFEIAATGATTVLAFWRVTYEWHIRKEGWNVEVYDRGIHKGRVADDAAGHGEFYSPGDILNGDLPIENIRDAQGLPINDPILLDGNCKPLPVGQPPVLITYQIYDEEDHNNLVAP